MWESDRDRLHMDARHGQETSKKSWQVVTSCGLDTVSIECLWARNGEAAAFPNRQKCWSWLDSFSVSISFIWSSGLGDRDSLTAKTSWDSRAYVYLTGLGGHW